MKLAEQLIDDYIKKLEENRFKQGFKSGLQKSAGQEIETAKFAWKVGKAVGRKAKSGAKTVGRKVKSGASVVGGKVKKKSITTRNKVTSAINKRRKK